MGFIFKNKDKLNLSRRRSFMKVYREFRKRIFFDENGFKEEKEPLPITNLMIIGIVKKWHFSL